VPQPLAGSVPAPVPTPTVPRPVALSSHREQVSMGPAWPAAGTTDALQSANVYIAYGRFSEAAANLRKALESQPGRNDIRFRLLEVLAQLGDVQGFVEEEVRLRASGFTPARIDELKARHAQLFAEPAHDLLDEAVLQLDEEPEASAEEGQEAKLNLDDLSLDADWDLVTPFAQPKAKRRVSSEDVFELGSSRDARSPFAENMLVEESSNSEWLDDELDEAFAESLKADSSPLLDDLEHLAGSPDNLAKLNMALAYIEQGSLESACNILNEVIAEGNEQQRQEARQLLAKIA
jgi:pilus assembly protein FimV